jgi:hypothetical protein
MRFSNKLLLGEAADLAKRPIDKGYSPAGVGAGDDGLIFRNEDFPIRNGIVHAHGNRPL